MKLSITLSVLALLALVNMGCSQAITEPITTSDEVTIISTKENTKKFKPSKDMISINPIRGNYTVKVGQQLYYSAHVHGSVGYSAEVYSVGDGLHLSDNFTEYDQEQESGMSGGDSAREYFIFDALKVGTYEVIAQHYFRGDLENEYTITITVEE